MPKNIFNFTLKCVNNTLATRKSLCKWPIVQSSACSFCLQPETLLYIVSSCRMYLEHGRYTCRHDSVLNFIAKYLSMLPDCSLYADLSSFLSPSIVTGKSFRCDLILLTNDKILYSLELTIGFETNIKIKHDRKASTHYPLRQTLLSKYNQVSFISLL